MTVDKICKNCGICPRTFYNHFKDKHDLISWTYVSVMEDSFKTYGDDLTLHTHLKAMVENVCEFSRFYQSAMKYTGQNNFRRSIFLPLRSSFHNMIQNIYHDELTDDLSDSVDFFIWGCLGFMEHYLLINDIVPADITVPLFERNIPSCLKKYLS